MESLAHLKHKTRNHWCKELKGKHQWKIKTERQREKQRSIRQMREWKESSTLECAENISRDENDTDPPQDGPDEIK